MQEEQRVTRGSPRPGAELLAPTRLATYQAVRGEDERGGAVRGAAVGDDDLVDAGGEAQPVEEASEGRLLVQGRDDYRKFQGPVTV